MKIITLKITSYRGSIGAEHYYGSLREYENLDAERIDVTFPMSAGDAAKINKKDGWVGARAHAAYKAGDMSSRFDTREDVIARGCEMAKELFGEDVQLYLGSPIYTLEDMEKIEITGRAL